MTGIVSKVFSDIDERWAGDLVEEYGNCYRTVRPWDILAHEGRIGDSWRGYASNLYETDKKVVVKLSAP